LVAFFCAVIKHNTVHSPVFRSPGLNRWVQVALTMTYGHMVSMFVPGHNLSHHRFLQQPRDRMRTDKLRLGWNLLNQALFSSDVGGAIFRDNLDCARAIRSREPRWLRQLLLETALFLVFMTALIFLSWKKLLLLFVVIPHQYAVWGITGINFVQHEGCDANHPYTHSCNFVGRPGELVHFQQRPARQPPPAPEPALEPLARGALQESQPKNRQAARAEIARGALLPRVPGARRAAALRWQQSGARADAKRRAVGADDAPTEAASAAARAAPRRAFPLVGRRFCEIDSARAVDYLHVFKVDRSALAKALPKLAAAMDDAGMLWICWPKKASGRATSLDENAVREMGLAAELVDVKVCAVDEVWPGLKFMRRLADQEGRETSVQSREEK